MNQQTIRRSPQALHIIAAVDETGPKPDWRYESATGVRYCWLTEKGSVTLDVENERAFATELVDAEVRYDRDKSGSYWFPYADRYITPPGCGITGLEAQIELFMVKLGVPVMFPRRENPTDPR
ncbi:MAG: hypothetical protein U0871_24345 [Gemmataceae bacterium]